MFPKLSLVLLGYYYFFPYHIVRQTVVMFYLRMRVGSSWQPVIDWLLLCMKKWAVTIGYPQTLFSRVQKFTVAALVLSNLFFKVKWPHFRNVRVGWGISSSNTHLRYTLPILVTFWTNSTLSPAHMRMELLLPQDGTPSAAGSSHRV